MNEQMNRLIQQLTADKKKFGMMVGLLAVGLLLWGRLLLKDVPRTATAAPKAAAADVSSSSSSPSTTSKVGTKRQPEITVVVDLPTAMTRDVFVLNTTSYRKGKNTGNQRFDEKPVQHTPDKAYRIAQAKEVARDLTLEGVILGGTKPSVIINGKLLQVGQSIEGMTVHRIENRKVVLEMDGVLIRLGM